MNFGLMDRITTALAVVICLCVALSICALVIGGTLRLVEWLF